MKDRNKSTLPFSEDNDPVGGYEEREISPVSNSGERLEYIRKERNLTRSAMARSIGTTPQWYNTLINSETINETTALAVEYVHGFNKEWLMFGRGDMTCDIWAKIRGEVEDITVKSIRTMLYQRHKRVIPLITYKEDYAKR